MILPIPLAIPPINTLSANIHIVPFYSQFKDIHTISWQKVGCGIASLAMIIDYHSSQNISVDTLLQQGIKEGAYNNSNGWIHEGLISLSKKYNMKGVSYDLSSLSKDKSLEKLKSYLIDGPVIVSVHYKFDPKSSIPHLVVIDGISGVDVYYNDPAAKVGQKKISIIDFQKGWKKRLIVIRPIQEKVT